MTVVCSYLYEMIESLTCHYDFNSHVTVKGVYVSYENRKRKCGQQNDVHAIVVFITFTEFTDCWMLIILLEPLAWGQPVAVCFWIFLLQMIIFALSVSFLLTGMAYFGLQCCWSYTPVNLHNDPSWGASQTSLRSMLQLTFSGIHRRYWESTACSSTSVQSSIKSFCDAMLSTHERLMIFCLKLVCAVSLSSIWLRVLFTLHLKQSFDSTWLWMSVYSSNLEYQTSRWKSTDLYMPDVDQHQWILTFIFRVNRQLMEYESWA